MATISAAELKRLYDEAVNKYGYSYADFLALAKQYDVNEAELNQALKGEDVQIGYEAPTAEEIRQAEAVHQEVVGSQQEQKISGEELRNLVGNIKKAGYSMNQIYDLAAQYDVTPQELNAIMGGANTAVGYRAPTDYELERFQTIRESNPEASKAADRIYAESLANRQENLNVTRPDLNVTRSGLNVTRPGYKDRAGQGVDIAGSTGLREAYMPYVERMLERASAEADVPFQAYEGISPLIQKAQSGIANLRTPGQFLQGSNLATAAGIGALGYGQYKPTQFTTGTFANPVQGIRGDIINFAEKYANTPASAQQVDTLDQYLRANPNATFQSGVNQLLGVGKPTSIQDQIIDFAQRYSGTQASPEQLNTLNTYMQSNPNATFQTGVNQLLGLNQPSTGKAYGGEVEGYQTGGDVTVGGTQPDLMNPSLQPINYGGQNVTNVQASYMSPYMQNVVDVQQREAKRQADIANQAIGARAAQAGAFGGTRHGLMEAEANRNLQTQLGGIQAKGLQDAFSQGLSQFNVEQNRGLEAQKLGEQSRQFGADLGLRGLQTGIQSAGVLGSLGAQQSASDLARLRALYDMGAGERTFDYNEFLRSEKYPYENLKFMQSMLAGLPTSAATTGISPATEALIGALGLNKLIG